MINNGIRRTSQEEKGRWIPNLSKRLERVQLTYRDEEEWNEMTVKVLLSSTNGNHWTLNQSNGVRHA